MLQSLHLMISIKTACKLTEIRGELVLGAGELSDPLCFLRHGSKQMLNTISSLVPIAELMEL